MTRSFLHAGHIPLDAKADTRDACCRGVGGAACCRGMGGARAASVWVVRRAASDWVVRVLHRCGWCACCIGVGGARGYCDSLKGGIAYHPGVSSLPQHDCGSVGGLLDWWQASVKERLPSISVWVGRVLHRCGWGACCIGMGGARAASVWVGRRAAGAWVVRRF